MPQSLVYTLKHPFAFTESRRVEQVMITLTLKVRDMAKISRVEDPVDREIRIISTLTGEDPEVIGALEMEDYNAIQQLITPFFKGFQQGAGDPSALI